MSNRCKPAQQYTNSPWLRLIHRKIRWIALVPQAQSLTGVPMSLSAAAEDMGKKTPSRAFSVLCSLGPS